MSGLSAGSADSKAVQQLSTDFAKLRKELTDATNFLPPYNQRQCELQLKEVEGSLEKLRTAAAPKPKFAFKRKAVPSVQSPLPTASPASRDAPEKAVVVTSSNATPSTGVTISGRSHEFIDLSSLPPSVSATDLIISDLDHCVLYMLPRPGLEDDTARDVRITALHARNVRNSVLIMPMIEGSALLHDVSQCVLALGCHQYRMHTSTQTDVYISLASNPVIEHCKEIRFANYPRFLQRAGDEYPSTLTVQDFSHIRPTPSPNWSILPEDAVSPEEHWPKPGVADNIDVDLVLQLLLPSSRG
ncbi:hypothetical protein EVJ58_g3433 [Rhodofomes roseus]|uniref:C-CAP/cofactor C-like domain-containing protein n=1 Tax=Rhodofomes roseus TaxID=34475 RepID=A0A4Y9YNA2_9APHY|nr:hypothetical protein EVJ58_g3433 [Rhodofomes roseus]